MYIDSKKGWWSISSSYGLDIVHIVYKDIVLVTMNYRLGALGILFNIYLFVYKYKSHPLNKIVLSQNGSTIVWFYLVYVLCSTSPWS